MERSRGWREGGDSSLGRLGQVPLHVQREVIAAREGALADGAAEGFGAGVLAVVACEFV